jgi:hypothetical protein
MRHLLIAERIVRLHGGVTRGGGRSLQRLRTFAAIETLEVVRKRHLRGRAVVDVEH